MAETVPLVGIGGPELDVLVDRTKTEFREKYGRDAGWMVAAPGRVNLIGEHTDYNGGYVLPMAIDRYVVIAAARRSPAEDSSAGDAHIFSASFDESARLPLRGKMEPGPVNWSSYMQGVVAGFTALGFSLEPFDAVVRSSVPLGGGLSSSAALEVATATLFEAMLGHSLDASEKALLCQQAEHRFAGVPCGIMDQFSSVFCEENKLMLLDCQSQGIDLVPLSDPNVTVLIVNSNVKHELTGGEYAERRAQCEAAAKALGVATLRDVTSEELAAAHHKLNHVQHQRARHVIGEIERTVNAAEAIRDGRWNDVGRLMYASHESLRDDYEVSCKELDVLVDLAREIGEDGGVIGSRMTGGGFGGCTVSLVRTESAADVSSRIHQQYQQQTGIEPTAFTTRPAQGAHVIEAAAP